ncbi:restriction endonuclease [Burkholderia gladioli]|uniref:restriction endonuclease n=1 Tax=Burkholderia gladioli TaxID=28095 RepID=UPI00163DFD0B|nr:restriction endonuclease [Burkholderia gladioli]
MTIVEAIKQVMQEAKRPLTAREAFTAIIEMSLYEFHAKDPLHVVAMQIRRHCVDLEFPSAAPTKHFQLHGDDRYSPLPAALKGSPGSRRRILRAAKERVAEPSDANSLTEVEKQLWALHAKYLELFEEHMLRELKRLSPAGFEAFARDLLDAYGFTETVVTSISRDGGIDGHGKLKVGLAHLNVAFQCKRWTNGNIQRPEIDKFRGASQGAYEQGIFFTTASFSKGAIGASIQRGAIPVVLIDGAAIVSLMVEKKFRVESNAMDIPAFAL